MSTELLSRVDEILKKANTPDRHTFFQIEKFIIGKEPTAQSQLWAIVRELQARMDTVSQLQNDLLDSDDNAELINIRIEKLGREIRHLSVNKPPHYDLNIKEAEVNIRKLKRDSFRLADTSAKLNSKLRSTLEEINYLTSGYDKIVSQYGEMKPLDDEQSQKEMWNEKLLEEFNLRIILQRPFDPEFIKTVLCLHDEAPVKKQTIAMVNNIQRNMIESRLNGSPRLKPNLDHCLLNNPLQSSNTNRVE